MLKTKIVLRAKPATENTAVATIISTSVKAESFFENRLIDIELNAVLGDKRRIGAMVGDPAVGPVQTDGHKAQARIDVGTANSRRTSRDSPKVGDSLLPSGGLGIVYTRKSGGD